MARYTVEDIYRMIEEEDVSFIRLQFTNMFGELKNMAVTTGQLEKVLANGCSFDGSLIEGFTGVEESDLYLYPDLDTFEIFPWRPQQGKVARFLCDVYRSDGKPFEGDPRYILRQALKEADEAGYVFHVGPECEFFLFDLDENGDPTVHTEEKGTYLDVGPIDYGENARREMVMTLEEMGFRVESSFHEHAPGQHEIDFHFCNALEAADRIVTLKMAVKTIARRHGLHATFMPKPHTGKYGSGMHINMSISKDGKNLFDDPDDEHGLSKEAQYFIGGLLKHVGAMTAITNPLVNSYKRLQRGYDVPTYIAWSLTNRSPLLRVPAARGEATRIELRSPDPATNPYLAFAACIKAGMDGIKHKILPPTRVADHNIYEMSIEECEMLGIKRLPDNLMAAVELFKQDDLMLSVMGEHICRKYIEAKTKEWEDYNATVSKWELEHYLSRY